MKTSKCLFGRMNQRRMSKRSRPAFEALEDRCLMAAGWVGNFRDIPSLPLTVTASLSQGVLHIQGTYGADQITVRQINNQISVDGVAGSFAVGQVQNIEIDTFSGNDTVLLNSEETPGQQAILIPCLIHGGSGNDGIVGSAASDVIFGEAGDDQIWAQAGNDYVDGGDGVDILFGRSGNDSLMGDLGNDTAIGGQGADYLVGGDGNDSLLGGTEIDWIDGSAGGDVLKGEAGADHLYDAGSGNSFIDSGANDRVSGHFGWFDMKIQDAMLRSVARYLGRDSCLSRPDMLQVFDQVEKDGTVSSGEYSDLKDILAGGSFAPYLTGYVANLSKKVITGDAANAHYLCGTLGNLYAGATGAHLEKLVNKWFLGLDRPASANGTYQFVAGSLFQGGIQYTDVRQGGVGDCYLMATLAKLAQKAPATIQNMFINNGDGTFTVRFFHSGAAEYVTVDSMLPVNGSGTATYAWFGGSAGSSTNELWVALAEKAYAQLNESGWTGQDGTNTYAGIDLGRPDDAMRQLTGKSATGYMALNRNDLIAAVNAGKLVALSSKKEEADIPDDVPVVNRHVYAVMGYSSSTGQFTLYNPWGSSLNLTWSQIEAGFRAWHKGDVV